MERSAKGRGGKVGLVQAEERAFGWGKQHKHRHGEKARCMWPGDSCAKALLPTEARVSPALWVFLAPESGGGRDPGLPALVWHTHWLSRPPHPQPWLWLRPPALLGKMLSLGRPPGLLGTGCSQSRAQQRCPGTQEDSKCQPAIPWVAQGPTEPKGSQAKTQPEHLGVWPPLEALS